MLKATARALAGERFEPIDPDALLGLGPLGLRATGQRLADGGELVVEARPVIAPVDERLFCASCGAMGRRAGTVARLLAHAPTAGRVTRLLVRVPRIACQLCRRVWRVDISSVAGPRSILTRSAAAWALEAVALDNMAVSRVAARLGVSWDTANDAVLKAGMEALGPLEDRLTGARVIGIDEHVWRHTRRGDKYVTVIIDLTPTRTRTGPSRLLAVVEGRSKQAIGVLARSPDHGVPGPGRDRCDGRGYRLQDRRGRNDRYRHHRDGSLSCGGPDMGTSSTAAAQRVQ